MPAQSLRIHAAYLLLACLPAGAQGLRPHQAQAVKPYPSRPVQAEGPQASPTEASFFFRTFGLTVPGGVFSWDDLATRTRTTVVAAGTLTKGSILIRPDGTYTWNSAWEGRLLQGRWIRHKDGLLLQQGQERKNWILGRLPRPSGRAEVYLFDGNAMTYHGTARPAEP